MSFCLFFYQNVLVQFEKTIISVCFVVFPEKKMLNLKLFFFYFFNSLFIFHQALQ